MLFQPGIICLAKYVLLWFYVTVLLVYDDDDDDDKIVLERVKEGWKMLDWKLCPWKNFLPVCMGVSRCS